MLLFSQPKRIMVFLFVASKTSNEASSALLVTQCPACLALARRFRRVPRF